MAKKGVVIASLTIFMAHFGATIAATYNVGDTAGWTTKGNIDYNKWAQGKEFRVGDILVFEYNSAMHDVRQVSEQDFKSCNGKSAISQYTSGSDSITLKTAGHHYFLCGLPGHCQAGQKVDINVLAGSLSPAETSQGPAASPSSPESSSSTPASTGSSTETSSSPAEPSGSALFTSSHWLVAPGMLAVFVAAGFA